MGSEIASGDSVPTLVSLASSVLGGVIEASASTFFAKYEKRRRPTGHPQNQGESKEPTIGPSTGTLTQRLIDGLDEEAFALRVREAYTWASTIHVQGMTEPTNTEVSTIELRFASVARRFRGSSPTRESFDESYLLRSDKSFLVLGDPGSGKTTTLKRLTLATFNQAEGSQSPKGHSFPILIVCREIDWTLTDLGTEVLSRLGLDPILTERLLADHLIHGKSNMDPAQLRDRIDKLVLDLAGLIIDDVGGLVIVDGIDEVPGRETRIHLTNAIARLRRLCGRAQIVCSSRSGDQVHIEGLSIADLLPLTPTQVSGVLSRRDIDEVAFRKAIAETGMKDLTDRPLFLNHLITVFQNTGKLPERPVDLSGQLIRLLLHEWDEQRRIMRPTDYAMFDNEVKRDFLAEIAFRLTLQRRIVFSERDLLDSYRVIAPAFGLPENQGIKVIREIESHVGIIAEVSDGFQFSHLTLQEYLTAECMVRQGMTDEVAEYLEEYPEVIAVAIALSTRPSLWLTKCLRRARAQLGADWNADPFGNRLGLERPRFVVEVQLGEQLLSLLVLARNARNWEKLAAMSAIRESLAMTERTFNFERRREVIYFSRRIFDQIDVSRQIPPGSIPISIFDLFFDD